MTENCTIYCIRPCPSVRECVRDIFPITKLVEKDGSLIIEGTGGTLRISSKQFEQQGDEFSRLVYTTMVHFEWIKTAAESAKARLLTHVGDTKCILGIVADPEFDADERFNQAVFAIAKACNGIVFNGYEMLDENGILILDNDGKSESEG